MTTLLTDMHVRERLVEVRTVITHKPSDIFIVFVDLWIGISLLASSPKRESAPAFTVAKSVMDVRWWGLLYTVLAVLVLSALLCRRKGWRTAFCRLADITRLAGPGLYSFWAITFFLAALTQSTASFVAVGAYAYLAYRHSFCPVPGLQR